MNTAAMLSGTCNSITVLFWVGVLRVGRREVVLLLGVNVVVHTISDISMSMIRVRRRLPGSL